MEGIKQESIEQTVFDLKDLNCVSKNNDDFSNRGRDCVYLVERGKTDNDIYNLLNIKSDDLNIYVTHVTHVTNRRLPFGSGYLRDDLSDELTPGSSVHIWIAKKHDNVRVNKKQTIVLTADNLELNSMLIRDSNSFYDKRSVTLRFHRQVQESDHFLRDSDNAIFIDCEPKILESDFALSLGRDGRITCLGKTIAFDQFKLLLRNDQYYDLPDNEKLSFSFENIDAIAKYLTNENSIKNVLYCAFRSDLVKRDDLKTPGIKKMFTKLQPLYNELWEKEEIFPLMAYRSLVKECKRTVNGVKVSKLFNDFFRGIDNIDDFREKLNTVYSAYLEYKRKDKYYYTYKFEELFPFLSGYKDMRKQALKSQSGRALSKMLEDIDSIQFDEEKYPIVAGLIKDGTIPTTAFFRKEGAETYFIFNDNWELFEEFLKHHKDIGIELAQLASRRTTYEKSLMSYMYFILYELPDYLKKHTGKSWKCIPKIVDSPNELEPQRSNDRNGTTKTRSALTPIVDNAARTVVVPYACLQIPGRSTTYTYSLNYSVLKRGLSWQGSVCLHDLEEKLNGRDDYGLMFYTLTGSAAGRGYPSFLIIFEHLDKKKTKVHFHRVHPLRSKNNDQNPIHNWIQTCYNWMAGNINLNRIKVQQGDLVFVEIDNIPDGENTEVEQYDSHCFKQPVEFTPYTKKKKDNILGYFDIREDTVLSHPEHRDRLVPAGKYELRQCRSWEANPKGIWSLRID